MPKNLSKDLDRFIVDKLLSDSKVRVDILAKEYGVSPGTIRNRITQLLDKSIIIGYKARARLSRLGMSEAIVGLDIMPESYAKAIESLSKLDFVKELYRASGDHSAIAIITADSEEIDEKMKRMMAVEGVRNTYPSYIQEVIK